MSNVGVVLVQIRCNTLCDDTHDIHDIARNHTIKLRNRTYFHDIHDTNGVAKTPRDKFLSYIQKALLCRAFCVLWAVQFVKTLPSYLLFAVFMV